MMKTPLCELLGIEAPIIQGGMAWIADAELAAAVSNAGGLGLISAMNADAEWLRTQIRKAKTLTNKPFGVNIMLMSPFADQVAQVVVEEQVKVVTTGAGTPAKYMPMWKEAGIAVLPVVASVAFAKLAERSGATAVIAEGCESGGHIGELTTMAIVPQVCDAVKIPVIAAGGIGDGRGVAAALMLGAIGVQIGTRFLTAHECNVHAVYKERILKAKDIDTIATGKRLGHPVRCLKTPFSRELMKMESDANVSIEALEAKGVGALRRAVQEGDLEGGTFMAGQIAGMMKKEQSCAEIIAEMMDEAATLLGGAGKWVR
ncbi:MAG: nitronate monooxygenase [Oscillospiraceae bacterium]|jgi:enoyl-[acyl-carrier protein] reductase II|nr:nitronate monooxygenase [Oscillospiraceae bacterium]